MLFDNTEKTKNHHENAPQVLFVAEPQRQQFHESLIIVNYHVAS